VIYTFWYHPMESTGGHLVGIFYTALLMLQGSLFFTRVHTNPWWTVFLEVLVVVHGSLVAVLQANGMWPMFLFGFLGVFVITQMHGLGLSRTVRWAIGLTYLAAVAWVYTTLRPPSALSEVPRIPVIDYALVFAIGGLILTASHIARRLRRQRGGSVRDAI
jgi:hypothetical protein